MSGMLSGNSSMHHKAGNRTHKTDLHTNWLMVWCNSAVYSYLFYWKYFMSNHPVHADTGTHNASTTKHPHSRLGYSDASLNVMCSHWLAALTNKLPDPVAFHWFSDRRDISPVKFQLSMHTNSPLIMELWRTFAQALSGWSLFALAMSSKPLTEWLCCYAAVSWVNWQ